jgi:cell division septal protein FtsQ
MPKYRTKSRPNPKQRLLPLFLALAGLVLVMFGGWALLSNNAQTKANIEVKGAPRLKVEKEIIDHGDVKLGTQIRDDVTITNTGDQPLHFTQAPYLEVKEGC